MSRQGREPGAVNPTRVTQKLLDEAFLVTKVPFNEAGHEAARAELQRKYPDIDPSIIDEAYTRARALEHVCYDFGDRCRLDSITKEDALEEMRQRFPGFSRGTYRNALGYGYLISR
jgi:hypothetical protein